MVCSHADRASRQEVQPADIDRSTAIDRKSSTLNGLPSLRLDLRQPFNAHKAGIVERFSPIRF